MAGEAIAEKTRRLYLTDEKDLARVVAQRSLGANNKRRNKQALSRIT
jgi:hypothetical protein